MLATGLSVAKTLIKYNINSLKENDEEEKKPINIKLTEQKQILIMMKILLTLNERIVQEGEWKILPRLTSLRAYESMPMRKFSQKNTRLFFMVVVSYLMKRKIKKIFLK